MEVSSLRVVGGKSLDDFFAHSVLSKLASPQAEQLILFFRKVSKCCSSMRDLIKDAPLFDRKRKKPGAQQN